jgi:hypothetical protein
MDSPLNEKHYRLAESFGISRCQIYVFDSLDELKQLASSRGVIDEEIRQYTEETCGLNIRENSKCGVSACEIFIRRNGHLNGGKQSYDRLKGRDLQPSIRFMDNDGAIFYAFVLLHEIAHTLLNHDAQNSAEIYDRNELEADEWAFSRLMESTEFFQ